MNDHPSFAFGAPLGESKVEIAQVNSADFSQDGDGFWQLLQQTHIPVVPSIPTTRLHTG